MGQAEELLDSLTPEQIAAYSVDTDDEPHIVIGNDRRISVPESLRRIAVQYDHNVETVMFDCPRYWDNLDMSQMAIYINYMRSDKYGDSYPADNVTVDGDIMHFTWTISRNVTEAAGKIVFLVCVKKTNEDGEEVNHWNSEPCADMHVSEGLETEEQWLDSTMDIVTQLLLRMDSVEQVNVTKDYIDGLASTAETAATEAVAARNELGDAIEILGDLDAALDHILELQNSILEG